MELIIIAIFCLLLLLCLMLHASILYALLAGLFIFCAYTKSKSFTIKQILQMLFEGIAAARSILIVFFLIGSLTALWRSCGTIALIISYAVNLLQPQTIILMSFWLNCFISFLIGTSFGTAATMGVITTSVGLSMGADPLLLGGSMLAGVFFGDRCSPVSTSALLVSQLSITDIFENIKNMLRSALLPFIISSAVYLAGGMLLHAHSNTLDIHALLSRELVLRPIVVLPAVVIMLLSLLHVNVKNAMLASIAAALAINIFVQQAPLSTTLRTMLFGYAAKDANVASLLNGGGILSMLKVAAIVCISSSYSGIFRATGMLDKLQIQLQNIATRSNSFISILITSILTSCISCNQTLAIILTHQLCADIEPDRPRLANYLEDSVVVIAPLIPWSIAGAVPLATVGAPANSIFYACFLYLLPCCALWRSLRGSKKLLS